MSKKHSTNNPTEPAVFDLISHLATPIAPVAQPVVLDEAAETNTDYDVQLDEAPEPQPQPGPQQQYFRPEYAQPQPYTGAQTYEAPPSLTPDDIAIIGVNAFDGIQQLLLTLASKRMILTEEERDLLPSLDTTGKIAYPDGSKEALAMAKYKKHLETVKQLPFDDGEKQRLQDAGKIYARAVNMQVTPLQGLFGAITEVMIKRGSNILMAGI